MIGPLYDLWKTDLYDKKKFTNDKVTSLVFLQYMHDAQRQTNNHTDKRQKDIQVQQTLTTFILKTFYSPKNVKNK